MTSKILIVQTCAWLSLIRGRGVSSRLKNYVGIMRIHLSLLLHILIWRWGWHSRSTCMSISWSKYFFKSVFNLFLFILNLLHWFHIWNQEKTTENYQNKHWFQTWNQRKRFKMNKKGWKRYKKYFDQLSGAHSTRCTFL